jgi:hypothetical protein
VAVPSTLLSDGITAEALVSQLIALAAAGVIWPVDPEASAARVARMNAVLERRADGADGIDFRAATAGTAVAVSGQQKSELP